jgi:hypothetical protein
MIAKHNTTYEQIFDYAVEHELQDNLVARSAKSQESQEPIVDQVAVKTEGASTKIESNQAPTCHHCGKTFKNRKTMAEHFRMDGNCEHIRF